MMRLPFEMLIIFRWLNRETVLGKFLRTRVLGIFLLVFYEERQQDINECFIPFGMPGKSYDRLGQYLSWPTRVSSKVARRGLERDILRLC